jgi:dipeptidyl aminopeptidase/acylaminoacyl peptidase
VQVAESVFPGGNTGKWAFSASNTGTLAVRVGEFGRRSQLVWVDRAGKHLADAGGVEGLGSFSLSPDEKRVALILGGGGKRDIWIREMSGGQPTRLTFQESVEGKPVWSPDGRFVVYETRPRPVRSYLFRKAVDGSSKEELLGEFNTQVVPEDWSGDGRFLAFVRPGVRENIQLLPMADNRGGPRQPVPYRNAPSVEYNLAFSPDSRWAAYTSVEGNEARVIVQTVPAGDARWQVSAGAGDFASWRRDGRELYYVAAGKLMAVPVATSGGGFRAGTPQALFEVGTTSRISSGVNYWPGADGRRFLVRVPEGGEAAMPPLDIVLHWPSTLKPTAR